MGTQAAIPSPQHRYLEPYKNRVFQYDTKHSNYFLSHYVNQILNAVGDDSIIRGMGVSASIDAKKTGIDFKIEPGSLVQDLTYFEFPNETPVSLDNIVNFSDHYAVIYTNWRYIETVYENKLQFEATLYNPKTKRALVPWNSVRNRIILGIFSFVVEDDKIVEIKREDINIFFEDANVIRNGTFDYGTTDGWTPINSTVRLVQSGGTLDSPYIDVDPGGDVFQGIAQSFLTKPNSTYEVSFYVKSDEATPFQALILDGSCVATMDGTEVKSYKSTSLKRWTYHTFRFNAFSTSSTIFLLKRSEGLDNDIYFDHIFVFEYTPSRKMSVLNNVPMVDGGKIVDQDNSSEETAKESHVYMWNLMSVDGVQKYLVDSTMPSMRNPDFGYYMVFFGGSIVPENRYYIDWKNNTVEFVPGYIAESGKEIDVYYVRKPSTDNFEWEIPLSASLFTYSPTRYQEKFPDPRFGNYAVFFGGKKMDESNYTINSSTNTITLNSDTVDLRQSSSIHIYYFTSPVVSSMWSLKTTASKNKYYLPNGSTPFPDGSNGKYLIFYNGEKMSEDDYLITPAENCITLDVTPAKSNIPIRIYYFGNDSEIDETPDIKTDHVYAWNIALVRKADGTKIVTYKIDASNQPLKNTSQGYYLVFVGGKKLRTTQYSINYVENKITFSTTAIPDDIPRPTAEVYFIAKPAGVTYNWSFTTKANTYEYVPGNTESPFQRTDNGTYMVFFGDTKLVQSEYDVLYTRNSIKLVRTVPVAQALILQATFITTPTTSHFWSFQGIKNVDTYSVADGQTNFDTLGNGEFLMFINGIKKDSSEYRVNVLKNALTLSTPPQESGSKIELYFLGKE